MSLSVDYKRKMRSPMYVYGKKDAERDMALSKPIGPQPPNPDYPAMYMKGYMEHYTPLKEER